MLAIQNTVIDDTITPAIEWIQGKAVQKLMPTDLHGILQLVFGEYLRAWVKSTHLPGRVASEWRFLIPPNSYGTESLVPDLAYLATYFELPKNERTYPRVPPDIAVEILSPGDDEAEVEARRKFLRWWGVKLFLIVDPAKRTVEAHETPNEARAFNETAILTSHAFASLTLPLQTIFAELDEPA